MTKFGVSILTVGCLALSMAACAPAFKGEGTLKPNLRKIEEKRLKSLADEAKKGIHIGSVKVDENQFKVEIKKADDLADADKEVIVTLGEDTSAKVQEERLSQDRSKKYTVSVQCGDDCSQIAVILKVSANEQGELPLSQEQAEASVAAAAAPEAQAEAPEAQAETQAAPAETTAQVAERIVGAIIVFDQGSEEGREITQKVIENTSATDQQIIEELTGLRTGLEASGRR